MAQCIAEMAHAESRPPTRGGAPASTLPPFFRLCSACCAALDDRSHFAECGHLLCSRCVGRAGDPLDPQRVPTCPICQAARRTLPFARQGAEMPQNIRQYVFGDSARMVDNAMKVLQFQRRHEQSNIRHLISKYNQLRNMYREREEELRDKEQTVHHYERLVHELKDQLRSYQQGAHDQNTAAYRPHSSPQGFSHTPYPLQHGNEGLASPSQQPIGIQGDSFGELPQRDRSRGFANGRGIVPAVTPFGYKVPTFTPRTVTPKTPNMLEESGNSRVGARAHQYRPHQAPLQSNGPGTHGFPRTSHLQRDAASRPNIGGNVPFATPRQSAPVVPAASPSPMKRKTQLFQPSPIANAQKSPLQGDLRGSSHDDRSTRPSDYHTTIPAAKRARTESIGDAQARARTSPAVQEPTRANLREEAPKQSKLAQLRGPMSAMKAVESPH